MSEDPIDAVYSYVERAYVRLQAGDILIRCIEEGNAAPVQHMVEELVLAGPQNLSLLREMRIEAALRKSQVLDDLHQIYSELESSLRSFGIRLAGGINPVTIKYLGSARFLNMLKEQGVLEKDIQSTCLQLLKETREIITSLRQHADLLEEIEVYLTDWSWGLAYQIARDGFGDSTSPDNSIAL
jgi:hypothetical protein